MKKSVLCGLRPGKTNWPAQLQRRASLEILDLTSIGLYSLGSEQQRH